jgi:hypothetical protein
MLLNTRFYVDKLLTRQLFLQLASDWLSTSDNYSLPAIEFNFDTEDYQIESEDGNQKLVINNYVEKFLFQLVINSDGATYVTNFVLDDISEKPSLHVSHDKTFAVMSAMNDKRQNVRIPNLLKTIFWNEYGDSDGCLPTDNKAITIRKNDVSLAASIVNQTTQFLNPIVYVSPNNQSGSPELDCEKVAQELMGQAHVVVEGSPYVANQVRQLTDGKNPFNGSVRIFLPGGETKTFYNRREGSFDYAVINAVRRMMSSVSIEDEFNISKIRQAHVFAKLANGEDKELYQLCEAMLSDKDSELEYLKTELSETKKQLRAAESKAESLQDGYNKNEDDETSNFVKLSVDSAEMYDGEIVDVILRVIQKEYNSMKDDQTLASSRKFDVLGDVLEHNFPRTTDTELINCIKSAFKDGALSREGIGYLQSAGFVVEKNGRQAHYKIYREGFEKYSATFSATPSDKARGVKNCVSDFCNVLFGC